MVLQAGYHSINAGGDLFGNVNKSTRAGGKTVDAAFQTSCGAAPCVLLFTCSLSHLGSQYSPNRGLTVAMQKTVLGKTGLKVSRMGIGGAYGISGDASIRAFELGLNYFFWMPAWQGLTDGLRQLVRTHRDDIVIAAGASAENRSLAGMQKTLQDALEILHTDYVDILQVPLGTADELDMALMPGGVLEWMREMRGKGSIRAIGSSTHNRSLAQQMAESGAFDMLMVRYNCAHRGAESEVFPATRAAGIGVVVFTVLRWGTLLQRPEEWPENGPLPSAVDCYRYVLNNPDVHLTLSGASTWQQLETNLRAADEGQPPLTPQETRWLIEFGDVVYRIPVSRQPPSPQSS